MESYTRYELASKIVLAVAPILKEAIAHLTEEFTCKTSTHDIVTKYDVLVESAVKRLIRENYPTDSIVGEELGRNLGSDYTWYIDPIDGTTNFVNQRANFSVSIGCFHNGESLFGIVCDIRRNVIYSAFKGQGAFINGERLSVCPKRDIQESLLYTSSFIDLYNWNSFRDGLRALASDVRAVRCMGCVSLEICQVAAGQADMMIALKSSSWDYSGAKTILEEAGGYICDLYGNDLEQDYAGPVLVFSSNELKDTVLKEYLK